MNLNSITKTQLRDFVESKISKTKLSLRKEIEDTVTERMSQELKELLGDVSELERCASRFEDLLTEKIHQLGESNVPDYAKTTAGQANKLCKTNKYFLDYLIPKALASILNPTQSAYYQFNCKPLMDVFNTLKSELQPKVTLYREGLETLKNELNNAITNESKGKQAYNALVALGVDMSDLPEVNPNLPSIVKLSVDVCVLNGDCSKQVSA